MKTVFVALVLLTGVCVLTSCQKEISAEENGTVQNDSIYISNLVFLDTTVTTPGQDTFIKYQFTYDGLKRLSKRVISYYTWQPVPVGLLLKQEDNYTYPGNETLPSAIYTTATNYVNPPSGYRDTIYMFYQNGILTKDSASFLGSGYSTHFAQLSPTRYRMIEKQLASADTSYCHVIWQNGNLVSETDSMWHGFTQTLTIVTTQISYDNKPNPLKRIFIPYPLPANPNLWHDDMESSEIFNPSNNNVVSWTSGTDTRSLQYEYGNNNMPSVARGWILGDPYKIIYQYTAL